MDNELTGLSNEELLEIYKEETNFIKYLEDLYKKGVQELEAENE